jgi:hypothetical protein
MKLKTSPFLLSLTLLLGLIGLLPWIYRQSTDADLLMWILGVSPCFGLALVLSICAREDQAGPRGVIFCVAGAVLGLVLTIAHWLVSYVADARTVVLAVGIGLVQGLSVYGVFVLLRHIYESNISYHHAHPIAALCGASALLLLVYPYTLMTQGMLGFVWVLVLGVGLLKLAGRRRTSRTQRRAA